MGTLRSWHECGEERTARQQHGTSQHVRAGHCFGSIQKPPATDPQQLLRWHSNLIRTNVAVARSWCTQLRFLARLHLAHSLPTSAHPAKQVDIWKIEAYAHDRRDQQVIDLSIALSFSFPAQLTSVSFPTTGCIQAGRVS